MEPQASFPPNRQLPARPAETRMTARMDEARQRIDQLVRWVTASDEPGMENTDNALAAVRRPLRMGIALVGFMLIFLIGFGALTPIESAALARGSVVVMNNRKTVQHLEGGVIDRILVKEGDSVKAGQPLVILNAVAARSNLDIAERDLLAAEASEARLLALRENKPTLEYSPALLDAAQKDPEILKALATQSELFTSQREGARNRQDVFRKRMAQLKEESAGLSAQKIAADRQLGFIAEELTALQTLLEQGLVPKPRVLELQRRQEELRGSRGQYQAMIAKAQQGIDENANQLANEQNAFAQQIGNELKDVQDHITQLQSQGDARKDVMQRTTITSPTDGTVTGLKYHTEGGVITPGTPIMDIVPQNADLIVEAKVQPTDIDVVHADLPARVLLSAYKTRNIPRLRGRVTQVSADAFSDPVGGGQSISYYTIQVKVDSEEMSKLQEKVKLYPGMPAEVYVITGSRSFLSYLFRPLTDSMHRAFREE